MELLKNYFNLVFIGSIAAVPVFILIYLILPITKKLNSDQIQRLRKFLKYLISFAIFIIVVGLLLFKSKSNNYTKLENSALKSKTAIIKDSIFEFSELKILIPKGSIIGEIQSNSQTQQYVYLLKHSDCQIEVRLSKVPLFNNISYIEFVKNFESKMRSSANNNFILLDSSRFKLNSTYHIIHDYKIQNSLPNIIDGTIIYVKSYSEKWIYAIDIQSIYSGCDDLSVSQIINSIEVKI